MAIATGFETTFLTGHTTPLPKSGGDDIGLAETGARRTDYTHFSLEMSASRRMCRWVAWNIDGADKKPTTDDRRNFTWDPSYADERQLGPGLYQADTLHRKNNFDMGHVASFSDVSWGPPEEADLARRQSCFYTNITPQLDTFNQSTKKGIWGCLENAIRDRNDVDHERISAFGGPVFGDGDWTFDSPDETYDGVRCPRSFWKVIAYVERGVLRAKGFILVQPRIEDHVHHLALDDFAIYQHAIPELADQLGLDMNVLARADTRTRPADHARPLDRPPSLVRPIDSLDDINAPGW